MKKILYIGNYQLGSKANASYMETLGGFLESEGHSLIYSSSKASKTARMLNMLWTIIKERNRVDLVLIDTYSTLNFYYAFFCSQLCRRFHIEYHCLLHGGKLPERLRKSPGMSKKIFCNAKSNIAPSMYLLEEFVNNGYMNTVYIPNIIETEKYSFTLRTLNKPRILWVRSFSEMYNPKLAVEVLDGLFSRGFDAELCMVGPEVDGSLKSTQEFADDLNLEVKFTGKLKKEEWIALSKNYNIFLNTTNIDNTPLSVIEAMCLGLAVVSTNVGGMPYLLENNVDGILVEPNNSELMVEAIIKLLNDKEFSSQITRSARTKAEAFSWTNVRSKWNKVLGITNSENN